MTWTKCWRLLFMMSHFICYCWGFSFQLFGFFSSQLLAFYLSEMRKLTFVLFYKKIWVINCNKGNAKHGISPCLKIRPCDLDCWPWKSIVFQILLRSKYVPSLVKIHWRMLILECSQGCYTVKIWPGDIDLWPWKSIGFQSLLRIKHVPSLVKIHWRMLILECSQGCDAVKIWHGDIDQGCYGR